MNYKCCICKKVINPDSPLFIYCDECWYQKYNSHRTTEEFIYFYSKDSNIGDVMFDRLRLITFYKTLLPNICSKSK